MSTPTFQIRHGALLNVTGRPVGTENVTFVPADVALAGEDSHYSHPLKDFLLHGSPVARSLIQPHQDAPWALGRILFLFGTHLLDDINEFRSEVSLYIQGFVAVIPAMENLSIPFLCGDSFCESSLMFSSEPSLATEIKDLIASAFWSLLLSNPTELAEYECGMLHAKIGCGRIRFGVEAGEPFFVDTNR